MKKLTLLLIIYLIGTQFSIGQKLRDKNVHIKYVKLPSQTLPDDFMTYSVDATGQALVKAEVTRTAYVNKFRMDGFKRLNGVGESAGHLRLQISAGYIDVATPEFKKRTRTKKDKDGNETSTTYYYYEYNFSNNTNYKVYDPNGKILAQGDVPYKKSFTSPENANSSAVRKSMNTYFRQYDTEFANAAVANAYSSISSTFRSKFDFTKERALHEIFIIKSHSSEDQFFKHYEKVKSIFAEADYATPSSELLEKLGPSIEYYKQHASKDPRGDKKKKRLYRAGNYNLALIYFYTDMFEEAAAHCEKILASEGKDAKAKRILKSIEFQEKRMTLHGVNTLHHFRDVENAKGPSELAALEAEKEEMADENMITKGIVFMGEDQLEGTLTLDKAADDFVFGEGGNVKFMIEENKELKEIDLLSSDVTSFQIADREFRKIKFSPSAKGKQEASLQILELVYSSDQIKLYKYYPSAGALSDEKPEFAFQKTGQVNPISLESTQFLIWKKGLAKFFSECSDLAEMCEDGGIEKSKEDLIKASRIYSEVCEQVIKP